MDEDNAVDKDSGCFSQKSNVTDDYYVDPCRILGSEKGRNYAIIEGGACDALQSAALPGGPEVRLFQLEER